jgi:RNA polymerase sigma-70 factor (sigma-E family)
VDEQVPNSFDEYVAARWSRLVRSAVLMGLDPHAAEDAVQTALSRCYFSWRRVVTARDPDAYVHRVLINTMRTSWRRRWTAEHPTDRLPEGKSDDVSNGVAQHVTLLDALARLPVSHRQVLVLRYYADLTEAQTAAALGIAVGTVKSRASRGLARLSVDPQLAGLTETTQEQEPR